MARIIRVMTILAILAALSISAANAEVFYEYYRVTPDNMQGWVVAARDSAHESTVEAGCRDLPGMIPPAPIGDEIPYGTGAFYADLGVVGGDYNDLDKVHFGTDQFSGIKLRDITKLEYWTYTYMEGVEPNPADPPLSGGLLGRYASQPFQLQIAYIKSYGIGGVPNWRYAMFRPWGIYGDSHLGEDQRPSNYNQWKKYEALYSGVWFDPLKANWTGTFYDLAWVGNPDTAQLLTPTQGWGYIVNNAPQTGTGCSLNLVVGAGRFPDGYFGGWWRESFEFRGFVDKFTIGIRLPNGDEVIKTYDFELNAGKTPFTVANNKGLYDSVMVNAAGKHMFRVFGKVVNADYDPNYITVDDGSGNTVRVYAPGHLAWYGDYVSAIGTLRNWGLPRMIITRKASDDVVVYPLPIL